MKKPDIKEEYSDDEIVYDDTDDSLVEQIKNLKARIKKLESEKQEYLDGWQRAKADFINFKKRNEEERKDFIKFANENFVQDLISTLDSFEMAFKDKKSWNSVSENWRKGIEYIYNNFLKTLEENGVGQICPIGEEFDPNHHQSVGEIDGPDGKIIEVVRKGYSLNGKIIRVPQVQVGRKQ